MFYGLASGAVDTGGIEIDQVLSDIETLNRKAFEGTYEVTAVSFHAYAHLVESTC
jgi:1,4-dihydroxy-6-naphthoate synthase